MRMSTRQSTKLFVFWNLHLEIGCDLICKSKFIYAHLISNGAMKQTVNFANCRIVNAIAVFVYAKV